MAMMELVREPETLENWTEIGNMQSIKGAKNIGMDKAMTLMYESAEKSCKKPILTFIEKDETVEHPWTLFTIECASYKDTKTPESQLWYIVQGRDALYTNFRAIREATIPEETKTTWVEFFKGGKIVYID